MEVNAILFDIRSIQKFIFSGNKLRTNIGASHITCNLFQSLLVDEILTDMAEAGELGSFDKTSWKTIQELHELPSDCFVAQVGGGKALILFRPTADATADKEKMKSVVRAFNRAVLERYPGLHTGAAIGSLDLEHFMDSEDKLFEKLKENQNTIYPIVNIPYTGLTLFCDVNGEAATCYDYRHQIVTETEARPRWFSHEVYAKASRGRAANKAMEDDFKDECCGRQFPLELEQLGQREGENYIAIVHIDGNKMGVKFRQCQQKPPEQQFAAYNALALTVQHSTQDAFKAVLRYIDENYERFGRGKDRLDLRGDYLPIRPLIFGGDDIAFVCAAKIALEITTVYMREMIKDEDTNKRLYTCAGIAILPANYPFFRGYQLSEQLCSAAKKNSRDPDPNKNSCWLDFAILHGEQAPTLEQIRTQEYCGAQGNMHFGPYRVDVDNSHESINKLFACTQSLMNPNFPRNKIKEMRNVLAHDEHDIRNFLEQLKHDGKAIPHVTGWQEYEEKLWHRQSNGEDGRMRTPYIDAIEMMDFMIPKDDAAEGGEINA